MVRFFHELFALLFYVLGTSFFLAYMLTFNQIGNGLPLWWMQVADLPLVISACVYGGSSLYLMHVRPGEKNYPLFLTIAIPLACLVVFLTIFNFWEALGLPAGQA